jgi:hypothetical protein
MVSMKISTEEKLLKALWHAAIATVGLFELEHSRTVLSKVLSTGLIAFHLDAAINDALDRPTTLQALLNSLRREA